MKRLIILILLALLLLPLHAQNFTKIKYDQHITVSKSADDSVYSVQIDSPATGMVLLIDKADSYEGSYVIIDGDTTMLAVDDENDGNVDRMFSNLILFNSRVNCFLLYPAGINHEITFYYIDARMKEPTKKPTEVKKKSADCSAPDMIEQSIWREGLPAPDYERINQKVWNVIIHHTAGSNSDTNYTEVIRNIYIYHTQIQGWSDIGYNYLIAPNGNIFKGRDPGIYEQDNVKGAHFCASNSGTMGVSVMGDYTDIVPSDTALYSLIELLSWKLGKEHLNPLGSSYHPLNPELATIAGHRDGCATECPGSAFYALFNDIRNEVMEEFNQCGYFISSLNPLVQSNEGIKIYYNNDLIRLFSERSGIETISVFDMLGRSIPFEIAGKSNEEIQIKMTPQSTGIYLIFCQTSTGYFSEKILIDW
jgi:hypothetical protein